MANITYRVTSTPTLPGSTTVKGSPLTNNEVDANFKAIDNDLALKAPLASPALTGTPTAPTATVGTNTTQIATTAYVIAERSATATLTNKTVTDNSFTIQDNADNSKKAQFELSAISAATTRTYTLPNATGTLASLANIAQTFSGAITFSQDTIFSSTGSIKVPVGTTAQRPTGANGLLRYNSTTLTFEGYSNGEWGPIGGAGGATGGNNNAAFWENDITITSSYTITAGKNAGTFGPVTIADGVTVTVPDGSAWSIV